MASLRNSTLAVVFSLNPIWEGCGKITTVDYLRGPEYYSVEDRDKNCKHGGDDIGDQTNWSPKWSLYVQPSTFL